MQISICSWLALWARIRSSSTWSIRWSSNRVSTIWDAAKWCWRCRHPFILCVVLNRVSIPFLISLSFLFTALDLLQWYWLSDLSLHLRAVSNTLWASFYSQGATRAVPAPTVQHESEQKQQTAQNQVHQSGILVFSQVQATSQSAWTMSNSASACLVVLYQAKLCQSSQSHNTQFGVSYFCITLSCFN